MIRPSRITKRLLLPALLAATLVVVQVVLAQPPVASFTVSAQSAGGCGTFTFTSTSTDADDPPDIQTTEWDFAYDGTFEAGGNGSPVTHAFPDAGSRTVALRVTDAAGGDDTTVDESIATQSVNVVNQGVPNGAVSASPNPAQPNQLVTFSAAGSTDPGGSIATYEWDLDNNGLYDNGTGVTATQAFPTAGEHTVGLRVTDSCGAQDTATGSVVVQNLSLIHI